MEDDNIIELYFARNADAITETEQKYGSYCYQVAFNILRYREDSEECVNDTWMRTWNSIPPERPSCLRLFLAKITRNLSLDRYRKRVAKKRGGEMKTEYIDEILGELNECVGAGFSAEDTASSSSSVEDEILSGELKDIINQFLRTLSERDRCIFLLRYFYGKDMREIAEKCLIREDNARKILFRARIKLKKCLEEEGYGL